MMKSEYAAIRTHNYLRAAGAPVRLDDLIRRAETLTDDGDPRWIGVALLRLNQEGEIRYLPREDGVICDDNHHHDSECAVKLVTA
jgi:hypothetical protein